MGQSQSAPRRDAFEDIEWSKHIREVVVSSRHTSGVGVDTMIVTFPYACVLDGVPVQEVWISRMDDPTLRAIGERRGRPVSTNVPHYFVVARTGPRHMYHHKGVHPVMLALVPISEGYWVKPVGDLTHPYQELKHQVERMLYKPLARFATLGDVKKTRWQAAMLKARGFEGAAAAWVSG